MDSEAIPVDLGDRSARTAWEAFLRRRGIAGFSASEVDPIDSTWGIFNDGGALVATGSAAGAILKYIAADPVGSDPGARFNAIMSALMSDRARRGIFHLFVSTGPHSIESFVHIGFTLLARTDLGALLETGDRGVGDYLADLPRVAEQERRRIGAIVMNANPFTRGHRAVVDRALAECDHVYVFVVSDDVSLFPTEVRMRLVREGLADEPRAIVASGGPYMVSRVTFPAYFLSSSTDAVAYQTALDARLFKRWIAPALNISMRFVGTEPLSKTTQRYNEALIRELPPEVSVSVMPRERTGGRVISATEVRAAIAAGDLSSVTDLVVPTTLSYITDHLQQLQESLRKG